MVKKLLFVVNVDFAFLWHRLPIALEAKKQGYEVHLAAGITDKLDELRAYGLIVHPLSIDRGSAGLFQELKTFLQIASLFKTIKPDIVHLVTSKPVIFGGIAARLMSVPAVVAAVPGLGFVFIAQGWKAALRRNLIKLMYHLALGKQNLKVIFQNPDDRDTISKIAGLQADQIEMIRGSGADLSRYACVPPPSDPTAVVVMVARLLADKGVREFVESARLLKQRGVAARFCLAGNIDPSNPTSITDAELAAWSNEGLIELLGYRTDISALYGAAHIAVLPSYREGLPKVLIEAAACGRAVVTTDVPGCRDAIEQGVTGLLVPAQDAKALADAIQSLITNRDHCKSMGLAGRKLAEKEFDIKKVVEAHLRIYQQLLEPIKTSSNTMQEITYEKNH